MPQRIYRLLLPLVFPDGISPGEGRLGNHLSLARDGSERPVLRGSALAGALRHGWMRMHGMDRVNAEQWFGCALEGVEGGTESPLRVPDCPLDIGKGAEMLKRTHIAVDRHRGSVLDGGLFTLDALPPGTATTACLWLHAPNEVQDDPKEFLSELVALFESGITLGGNAARGIGHAKLAGNALLREFDCSDLTQHADLLNEQYEWSRGVVPKFGNELKGCDVAEREFLRLELVLAIPQSEDILIGDGQGLDYEMEPQRVKCADGQTRWRLPGSTLRGALRGWITRLAARAGKPVADSYERRGDIAGDKLAWGYDDKDTRRQKQDLLEGENGLMMLEEQVPCPIMRLFGSSYSKSRIHISDALSSTPIDNNKSEQVRAHVAVDRLTGGANEGFFYQNSVLKGEVQFPFVITVWEPEEEEVRWLFCALRAIDLGIVRLGTSKASGRLALAEKPASSGKYAEIFNELTPSEV